MTDPKKKKRPDDGTYDEEILNQYVADTTSEHEQSERHADDEFGRLKRNRGYTDAEANDSELTQEQDKSKSSEVRSRSSQQRAKIKLDKIDFYALALRKRPGIFGRGNKMSGYGTAVGDKRIQKAMTHGANGVPMKERREFLQMLEKYHGLKRINTKYIEKEEIKKFEAGLRRGESDYRFKQFTNQLKKEGVIKKSEDVKKLFNRLDVKRMGNALLGRKTDGTTRALGEDAYNQRRADEIDSKLVRRGNHSENHPSSDLGGLR